MTVTLATTSTVIYDGGNQTVASFTYGNLILSNSSGAAVKTMPASTLTVLGNFSSTLGTGTSVAYTALTNFIVSGSFTVGIGTTFTPGFFIHTIGGNFISTCVINAVGSKFILNGAINQDISSVSAFNKLVINKVSGVVNLLSNINLNDSLVFIKGNIRTLGNKVIINTTGKVGGAGIATGWVFGTLQLSFATGVNITKTFDIGDSLKYAPAVLNITTVTVAGGVSARVTGTEHPLVAGSILNAIRSVNRFWTFTNNGLGFNNCKITFNWLVTDIDAGSTTTLFKVARYNGSWDTTAIVAPLPTSIQAIGITFFGDFAIGERCGSSVAGIWTGSLSTNWAAPENWQCGLVPNSTINALISTGLVRYPILSSGTGAAKNITIQSGASVIVTGGLLQLSGVISNSGLFDVTNGAVEFNGTVTQNIPSGVFLTNSIKDLTTSNPAGVNLLGLLNVSGKLKATVGNFATGGFVTLISTAAQTALIDGSGNGNILGSVTMQRFLQSGFGYKYFSSPFQSATVNEFSDDLNLLSTFPPFYRYNESSLTSGWVNYSNPAGLLVQMTGYAANFGNLAASKTVDISGVVNNNLQTITLKNTNKPFTLGFNLVGNPFPSPVDWDAPLGWNKTNIDNAVYCFDASSSDQYGGTYSTYINGISSNGVITNIIPSMQAFFIHVSDGSYPVNGTLQVNNLARTTDLQPVFHRATQFADRPLIRLEAKQSDFGMVKDAMVIYFEQNANDKFNKEKDALKLMNTDNDIPNIYSFSADGVRLSINALSDVLELTSKIPIGLITERDGFITFKASEIYELPDSLKVYFVDTELRTNHNLQLNPEFRIKLNKGIYENRFHLSFTSKELPFITDIDELGVYSSDGIVYVYYELPPGENGELTISNMQGQLLWQKKISTTGQFSIQPNFSTGIYIVNFRSVNTVFSKKLFLKNER
ncbi:MAG: T9SS type A sorting domain-containing protein [Bacteroidetes bacterium]|nr:T9SS type A sorting domain-containing protein [Bacteroidota bacterium]